MATKAVTLAQKGEEGADVLLPHTSADLVGYEKDNSTARNVKEALDELNDNFQGEAPGIVQRVEALESKVGDPAPLDPWEIFPAYVPIAVAGVTFGGSDGRRAIMPGEIEVRENWIKCDGGDDGKGGTMPDLRGRMILGASDAHPVGERGGAETHNHATSGTVGATTLTVNQLAAHSHVVSLRATTAGSTPAAVQNNSTAPTPYLNTNNAGGSQAHTHSLVNGSVASGSSLPPYYSMNFIMRIA